MNKRLWFFVVLTGLLAAMLLSACGQDMSAPELVVQASTPTETADLPTDAEPEVAAADQAVARVEFTDQACLTCHTNQDVLKALAVEEESTESLSSGPG